MWYLILVTLLADEAMLVNQMDKYETMSECYEQIHLYNQNFGSDERLICVRLSH
jgi:hypothetical protein